MIRHLLTLLTPMVVASLQATTIGSFRAEEFAAELFAELHDGTPTEMQVVAQDQAHATPAYYVCQPIVGEGYFIVSTASAEPQLIAYSEQGSFSLEALPTPFRQQLSRYADRLDQRDTSASHNAPQRSAAAASKIISPLCKASWSQYEPYWNLCPTDNGSRCLTGCTATAMAQVMYCHRYPETPVGTCSASMNWQRLPELNFADYRFEWGQMLTRYDAGTYTDEQANAVATLMLLCGYACNTNYSPKGSGAYMAPAVKGMIQNFGFSTSARLVLRQSYERDNFLAMIRTELEAKRPMLVQGRKANNDAHAFICDGMGLRNTVHINWGWGDSRNANVDLDVLTPSGDDDGYTHKVSFVFGLQPQQKGESRLLPPHLAICDSVKLNPNNNMLILPAIYNLGWEPIKIEMGAMIRQGGTQVGDVLLQRSATLDPECYSTPIYKVLSLPELADGDYTLQLVVRQKDADEPWGAVSSGDRPDGFTFSISNGKMTFGELSSIGMIEADHAAIANAPHAIETAAFSLSGARRDAPSPGFSIRNGKVIFTR